MALHPHESLNIVASAVAFVRRYMIAVLLIAPTAVLAKGNCTEKGALFFLGNTADGVRSVWLSATNSAGPIGASGYYRLDAAQANQNVDSWDKIGRGLHLSLSPVVSNGNGGTHKLFGDGQKPCLLDSQNQKGGIIPPGGFHRPPKPPTGITPTVPVKPEVPIGQLPPTGITPTVPVKPEVPIGQLPPTGITPTVPVKPEVPIGQLPPTGITPTVPVKPEVPIGQLPPTGITPTVPVKPEVPIGQLPPTGITPTVPVKPEVPIGQLPPTGITPTVPVKPEVPIGQLPPTGITPTVPVKPEVPIGQLPPTGITPTVPVKPEVPIGQLPPTGVTPTVPVNPEVPPVVVPDPATLAAGNHAAMATPCAGGRIDSTDLRASGDCNAAQMADGESAEPYTPGRFLVEPSLWNAWADVSYTNSRDERNNLDLESDAGTLTVGVDRLFDDRLAIGVQASINDSESESRSRTIEIEGNGMTFGPYLSYGLSEQWSLLFALDFGVLDRDVRLLNVSGEQDASQYSGSLEFQGQYGLESVLLRPWGLLSYTRSEGDAFALKGDVMGQSVTIRLPGTQADGSLAEVGLEASWLHELSNGKRLLPYVEAAARYSQVSSDSDLQLGGNLESTVDDWNGTLRGGARLLAGGTTMLELGAAYQSLGQSELYVWEFFFFVSHGF